MNRKMIILFGSVAVLLIIVVVLIISLTDGDKKWDNQVNVSTPYEGYITPSSGDGSQTGDQSASQPTSKTIGSITATQLDGGHYLLENKNDGYQITVTSDWIFSKEDIGSNLKLYYGDAENLKTGGAEMDNIAVLTVEVLDNSNKYSFSEWFKNLDELTSESLGARSSYKEIMINGQMAFRSSGKLEGYNVDDNGEILLRDDSSIVDYLFLKDSKVYRVTCTAFGNDYKNLVQVCENQIRSFSAK